MRRSCSNHIRSIRKFRATVSVRKVDQDPLFSTVIVPKSSAAGTTLNCSELYRNGSTALHPHREVAMLSWAPCSPGNACFQLLGTGDSRAGVHSLRISRAPIDPLNIRTCAQH